MNDIDIQHRTSENSLEGASLSSAPGRYEALEAIQGNASATTSLFDRHGIAKEEFIELLRTLPLQDIQTGVHLIDALEAQGPILHDTIESVLQETFFRPNETKFAFEIARDGEAPSAEQLAAFQKLGLIDAISIPPGAQYDAGVVFGGLLGAIDSRTNYFLAQEADIKCISLLGSQRRLLPHRGEAPDDIKRVIGDAFYEELEAQNALPETEYDLMRVVWEAKVRVRPELGSIAVVTVNSLLRSDEKRAAPGTPETVSDFCDSLTSGSPVPDLQAPPARFLLASSQPHSVRQREDFITDFVKHGYPLDQVDVVGYVPDRAPTLKLLGTELAKLVHAQYRQRNE